VRVCFPPLCFQLSFKQLTQQGCLYYVLVYLATQIWKRKQSTWTTKSDSGLQSCPTSIQIRLLALHQLLLHSILPYRLITQHSLAWWSPRSPTRWHRHDVQTGRERSPSATMWDTFTETSSCGTCWSTKQVPVRSPISMAHKVGEIDPLDQDQRKCKFHPSEKTYQG
jgi:hypothetical protein